VIFSGTSPSEIVGANEKISPRKMLFFQAVHKHNPQQIIFEKNEKKCMRGHTTKNYF